MKWIIIAIILLAVTACNKPDEIPSYTQKNYSNIESAGQKCIISEQTYYLSSYFIFHVDNVGSRVIYSPKGEYLKPKSYPRWQLRLYMDINDSTYTKTIDYIEARVLPNGEPITCYEVNSLPTAFDGFIDTHEAFFKMGGFEVLELV